MYCIVYFDIIKNVGKLLNFPEYFIKKEYLSKLQKYLFVKFLLEKNKIEMAWNEELSIEAEIELMIKLLPKELSNQFNENNLSNKTKSDNNTLKEIEYSEDEPNINKLEENDYEKSYTEEKVLEGIFSYNIDKNEELKNNSIFLKKKRKKEDQGEIRESKETNYMNQQIDYKSKLISNENEKKEINLNSLDPDMEIINKFDAEIPYEYHAESEDDEVCI